MPSAKNRGTSSQENVIFEKVRLKGHLKVTAIDPVTAREVSVVGPNTPTADRPLEQLALKKLKAILRSE